MAVSIKIHDQFATQLLDAVQRGKLKTALDVSHSATTKDEIYRELLKMHAAEVVSKPEAVKASPKAAAGGYSLADGASEQQAAEPQQSVDNPIRGPRRDTIQQVRWHCGTCLLAWCVMSPALHPAEVNHAHACAGFAAAGLDGC